MKGSADICWRKGDTCRKLDTSFIIFSSGSQWQPLICSPLQVDGFKCPLCISQRAHGTKATVVFCAIYMRPCRLYITHLSKRKKEQPFFPPSDGDDMQMYPSHNNHSLYNNDLQWVNMTQSIRCSPAEDGKACLYTMLCTSVTVFV